VSSSKADGIVFIPEMMDEVVLRSDLGAPVHGRPAVAATIERLDALYRSETVLFERRKDFRDIRISQATLTTGETVELIAVAIRDPNGWVCELHLSHDPKAPVKRLLADDPAAAA
jgi:hypothetical protein